MKAMAFVFALISLVSGVWSACYWLRSSNLVIDPGIAVSSGEHSMQQDGWLVALLGAATESSKLNSPAAKLSGICIFSGSIANFIGILS